jgi:hypothetical protein
MVPNIAIFFDRGTKSGDKGIWRLAVIRRQNDLLIGAGLTHTPRPVWHRPRPSNFKGILVLARRQKSTEGATRFGVSPTGPGSSAEATGNRFKPLNDYGVKPHIR